MIALARPILLTEIDGVGWACEDGEEQGTEIDFRGDQARISDEFTFNESAFDDLGIVTRTVYDIEVEEFHTFYVGEAGVWSHDMHCAQRLPTA